MKIIDEISYTLFIILRLWNPVYTLHLQHILIQSHFKCSTATFGGGQIKEISFRKEILKLLLQVFRGEYICSEDSNKVNDHVLTQVIIPRSE